MDVIATARTENIAEKKKNKKQKLKEMKRKKKLENRTNQNVEISSNEKCHGIAEADSYVGPALNLEESSHVDRARAKEITEKKTKSGRLNKTSMKKCTNQTNQCNEISNNEKCDAVAKGSSYAGSAVESLLRGSSREDRASNDSTENKRTAIEDEPLLELSNEERVLGDAGKEINDNETKKRKRKRKSKRRGDSKNELESSVVGLGVDVISLIKESPKVDNVLTKSQLPEKRKRCNSESRDANKDGHMICDKENKCLERKRCISTAESYINLVALTVDPLLQESTEVLEVSTEIVKEKMIPEEKRKGKKKSKARNRDAKVILDEKDECLKISVDSKRCIAASELHINVVESVDHLLQESPEVEDVLTEITKEKKTPNVKPKHKKKSKARDKNGNTILHKENNCLEIPVDKRSCVSASELCIKGEDLTVEPLLKESPDAKEVTTYIVNKEMTPVEKGRRKIESYYRDKNVKVILCEEDKCPQISSGKKSCIAASVSPIKDVGLNVESLGQDSPVVDEAKTEIVKGKKRAVGKQRQKKKLMARNKNKIEVPLIDLQNELLVNTINGKCSTKIVIGTVQGVDSKSKFPIDNVSSLGVSGKDNLPKNFYQLSKRKLTPCSRRILLVLDINGLLADIVMPAPKNQKSDIRMCGRAIFKRPYCDDFLNFCFDTFDVGIWSSRTKRIIDKVVEYLLGERKQKLLFCWDMSHATVSNFKSLENKHKPIVCKCLRNLWEKQDPALPWQKGDYTESNTLLIDDSPYKALLSPMHTAIFPDSFTYMDPLDNSIGPGGELRVYLQNLAKTNDVRKYVEEHPFGQCAITEKSYSWDFYSKVINSLSKYN